MLIKREVKELEKFALEIRIESLKEFKKLGFGHVGGSMSIIDALSVLYGKVMKIDPQNPNWDLRDWLVVSKGHSGPAVYATLALKGFFDKEELLTLNTPGTNLPSHCDMNKTKGIDMTTGSLGQGISTAIGVALGNKIDKKENYTYLIIGDGECDEGQIWEGALFASHYKLNNLVAFVDNNKQQLDGYTEDVLNLGDLEKKFKDFGWYAQSIDGHDIEAIYDAIENAKSQEEKPSMIILNTLKGKDCSFAEGKLLNHHMVLAENYADNAIEILCKKLENLRKDVVFSK